MSMINEHMLVAATKDWHNAQTKGIHVDTLNLPAAYTPAIKKPTTALPKTDKSMPTVMYARNTAAPYTIDRLRGALIIGLVR